MGQSDDDGVGNSPVTEAQLITILTGAKEKLAVARQPDGSIKAVPAGTACDAPPPPVRSLSSCLEECDMLERLDALGEIAWNAYREAVGGYAFNGDKLPTWAEMLADPKKAKLVEAWRITARAVAAAVMDTAIEKVEMLVDKQRAPRQSPVPDAATTPAPSVVPAESGS